MRFVHKNCARGAHSNTHTGARARLCEHRTRTHGDRHDGQRREGNIFIRRLHPSQFSCDIHFFSWLLLLRHCFRSFVFVCARSLRFFFFFPRILFFFFRSPHFPRAHSPAFHSHHSLARSPFRLSLCNSLHPFAFSFCRSTAH